MENKTFYNEVLIEHNQHPIHKEKLPDANLVLEGVNPSCGDDIILQLKVENDVIVDGAFEGSGCAISQASADIMLDMIIGRAFYNVISASVIAVFYGKNGNAIGRMIMLTIVAITISGRPALT